MLYLDPATGLVVKSIQSLKGLLLANLENELNLAESINCVLWVMIFTAKISGKLTPFKTHYDQKPATVIRNTLNTTLTLLSDLKGFRISENPTKVTFYVMLGGPINMATKKKKLVTKINRDES